MAVSTNSYFSNSIPGVSQVGVNIDVYKEDATPKFTVGFKVERADGNIYRYAHFGATAGAGDVVCPDLNESAEAYNDNAIIATNSAFQMPDETAGVYPSMKGSRYIVALLSSITASQFAGGYIGISSGTGLGYTYRIKDNKASSGTSCTIELYDKIAVGLDATSDIAISPCKYANLEPGISGTTQNSFPTGVAVADISTAGNYGWILTKGQIAIAQSGTLTTGKLAILSNTDAGHVEPYGNAAGAANTGSGLVPYLDIPIVGKIVLATATSGHAIINVELE